MGRIVILEGPDGGGKTTLANQLVEKGFQYQHDGPPPAGRDNIAYYLEVLYHAYLAPHDTVFDRLWLGERMYGPVARGSDNIGSEGQRLFLRLHQAWNVKMYLVWPNQDEIQANYLVKLKDSGDYLKSVDRFRAVCDRYFRWAYMFATMSELYDYRVNTVSDILMDFAISLEKGLKILPKGFVGSQSAKYLLIGENPNHVWIDVPFHSLTNSSGYFNDALILAGLKEEDICLGNAYSPDGVEHSLKEIVDAVPTIDKILLLGNRAYDWFIHQPLCAEHKVSYLLHHPSYVKRFKSNDPMVYAGFLREAIFGNTNSR
jgi:hypothetical protein